MKKIAIIYERELSIGGVETHILTLLKHINPKEYSYTIISPVSENFRHKAIALGTEVRPIPYFKPLNFSTLATMARLFRKEQIDLVHIHSPAAAITARLATFLTGLPNIVTVHAPSVFYYGERQTLRAKTGRSIYIQLDRLLNYTATRRLVYVSNRVFDDCITRRISPPDRSLVIHNGIDLAPYDRADSETLRMHLRMQENIPLETPIITYAGRLAEEKGLDVLLEALHILNRRRIPDYAVWLIGSGPLEAELAKKVDDLELQRHVHFLGYQEDVAKYLLVSDFFVMPSRHEAMSIAIMEALAAGLPCVVSDVGDNARLVEDGQAGLVVPANSSEALAAAIERLLADPTLRKTMSAKAGQKAKAFSVKQMIQQLESVYQLAIQG
jgi:glycosyltransferase involved in cell wall biosynthesis